MILFYLLATKMRLGVEKGGSGVVEEFFKGWLDNKKNA